MTLKEYKHQLKGLPKEEKINTIKQELVNMGLSAALQPGERVKQVVEYLPTNKELETLQNEIENNFEAYESETQRKDLIPFMYDRDLNWFFNAENIPAQRDLVMPTYEFFKEGKGKEIFEPLDFFNFFYKQYNDLQQDLSRPFDVLKKLASLPISEREKHTLYGFLIKWFGGFPVNHKNEQHNTLLKLIEKEFLTYPENTPEKEFCRNNREPKKELGKSAAGIRLTKSNDPEIEPQHYFAESKYLKKVAFDFEDLPKYVIQKSIIRKFEDKRMYKDEEYYEWQKELATFLDSIPNEHRVKALQKGIEYGKAVYQYHLNNECNSLGDCAFNESWERRFVLAEKLLTEALPQPNKNETEILSRLIELNEKSISKIDLFRILNVLCELRAFKKSNGQIAFKKDVIETLGKLLGLDYRNFHPDLNKAFEKSEEANTGIFDKMKDKAIELWSDKNYK